MTNTIEDKIEHLGASINNISVRDTLEDYRKLILIISDYLEKAKAVTTYLDIPPAILTNNINNIVIIKNKPIIPEETEVLVITKRNGTIPLSPLNAYPIPQLEAFLKWLVDKELELKNTVKFTK